jgi:hypothetical protein
MGRQVRRSGLVMGFDTRMIAGGRACSTSTQLTHSTITNQMSPHLAEALGRGPARDLWRGFRLAPVTISTWLKESA